MKSADKDYSIATSFVEMKKGFHRQLVILVENQPQDNPAQVPFVMPLMIKILPAGIKRRLTNQTLIIK